MTDRGTVIHSVGEVAMKLTLCLILAACASIVLLIGMATNMDILSWSVVPL